MKKIVIYASILLAIGIHTVLFGQESQESPEPPSGIAASAGKLVTLIEVKGNKAISANTIISKMKTRMGALYQENIASDDLKRLYLLGFFSDVKINTEDYKDGLKVIVNVTERALIEKISFSGITRLRAGEAKLKDSLKSKEGQYLDYPSLSDDVRTLKKMYEKIGYNKVKIDYKTAISKEANKAKVEFVAEEGKRTRIKNIKVEGNSAFSDRRILRLLKTRRGWLFNSGALKEDVLTEDIERLKAFYRKEGFADVQVEYQVIADEKNSFLLYVEIKIQEGKKYLVGNVDVQGAHDIEKKDVLSQLKVCIPGKVFSQEALKQDISSIQGLYFDRGYIFAQVQETTSLNADTGRIDIIYAIVENQVAYVNKIKISGNVKTKDVVIRRELRIRPGDQFDGIKLRRSKERLQRLGFFEEVSYDTQDTDILDKKDLLVQVKESKTGAFSFGGGYSTVDDFVGFIEVEQKNFDWKNFPYFTGDGQDLKMRASFGSISNSYTLSFTEPWLFDYPIAFGFDIYKRNHKRESDTGYGYDEDVSGGDLRLGKEFSEYLRIDLMYRFDTINISNITEEATSDLKRECGENSISSLKTTLTFDNRDSITDTLRGNVLSGSVETAGGPFGGDRDFLKFYGLASHYFPLFRNSALELRGRIGVADIYGNSDYLPIYERFFAGGAYTIRGYEERKVGPIDPVSKDPLGGESMLVGNVEYLYPLFTFLKVACFYDTGNVWEKMDDLGNGGFKSGFGLGVRVKTPIGPVMLDYGIPLNKEPGEDERKSGRFHFSMSHGF